MSPGIMPKSKVKRYWIQNTDNPMEDMTSGRTFL